MPPRPRAAPGRMVGAAVVLCLGGVLAGCGGASDPAPASSTVDPEIAALQARLAVLPTVDGATAGTRDVGRGAVRQTYTTPAGTPACLQVLAVLDAAGYAVVLPGSAEQVDPATCTTATGDPAATEAAGGGEILAQGGSQIALIWTADSYTVEADTPPGS